MTLPDGPFIERCPHDKENPYALINRELIRDFRLHPSVRWMIIYLLSMKNGWKISPKQLKKHCSGHFGCGRDKIYDWINEAIEAGYMKKEEWKEGGLKRCRYLLSEFPKFKKCLPRPDDQDPVQPDPVQTDYKKYHIPSEKNKHREEESTRARAKESARKPRAPLVFVSDEEHEKLVKEFGLDKLKMAYLRLSEWKDDTPKSKWKKNDHLAIKRWVIRAVEEDLKKAEKAPETAEKRLKEVHEYIQSHPKKELLQKAQNARLIYTHRTHIIIHLNPKRDEILDFHSPGAKEQIDNLLRKLEGRC